MRTIEVGAKPLPYLTCKLLGRFASALGKGQSQAVKVAFAFS